MPKSGIELAREFAWEFDTHKNSDLRALFAAVGEYAGWLPCARWLTLLGKPGCGKTHLARRLCRFWNAYHIQRWEKDAKGRQTSKVSRGMFRSWPRVVEFVLNKDHDRANPLPEMETAGFLAIDDMGAESKRLEEISRSSILRLMDYRDRNSLPTVFTSNKTVAQLIAWDERIYSRLNRNGTVFESAAGDYALHPDRKPKTAPKREDPDDWDGSPLQIENPQLAAAAERIAQKWKA